MIYYTKFLYFIILCKRLEHHCIQYHHESIYYSDEEISSRVLRDESNPESSRKRLAENSNLTLNQMFLTLFDVLQEYISLSNTDEKIFSSHEVSTIKDPLIDVNNNNIPVITTRTKQSRSCSDAAENFGNDDRVELLTEIVH